MIDWVIDWVIDRLIDWLIDWLIMECDCIEHAVVELCNRDRVAQIFLTFLQTSIGSILVALNPYRMFPEMYSLETVKTYESHHRLPDLPPYEFFPHLRHKDLTVTAAFFIM